MQSKTIKRDQVWLSHYEAWQTSGQKQKDYCFSKGLSYHMFKFNLTRIRKEAKSKSKSRFLPVPTDTLASVSNTHYLKKHISSLKLNVKEHYSIEIPTGFSQETLFQIINVLEKM
jgi:hypothetical protein